MLNHPNGTLELRSGRPITLKAINQIQTYSGLLEGFPIPVMNEPIIAYALELAAKEYVHLKAKPFLIPPDRRNYNVVPRDMDGARIGKWTAEYLPGVFCIGRFSSPWLTSARSDKDFSVLIVVWFQENYAFPISEVALEQLRDLDWDSHATDCYY